MMILSPAPLAFLQCSHPAPLPILQYCSPPAPLPLLHYFSPPAPLPCSPAIPAPRPLPALPPASLILPFVSRSPPPAVFLLQSDLLSTDFATLLLSPTDSASHLFYLPPHAY